MHLAESLAISIEGRYWSVTWYRRTCLRICFFHFVVPLSALVVRRASSLQTLQTTTIWTHSVLHEEGLLVGVRSIMKSKESGVQLGKDLLCFVLQPQVLPRLKRRRRSETCDGWKFDLAWLGLGSTGPYLGLSCGVELWAQRKAPLRYLVVEVSTA